MQYIPLDLVVMVAEYAARVTASRDVLFALSMPTTYRRNAFDVYTHCTYPARSAWHTDCIDRMVCRDCGQPIVVVMTIK